MSTISVSNSAQLYGALASAKGGETILLESGDYGALDLAGLKYSDYVTIRSADPDNEAFISGLDVKSSAYIRIDDLRVGSGNVDIRDYSHHIEVINSDIGGSAGTYTGYGIYLKNADDIRIENNYVHNVFTGISAFSGENIVVSENYVDYVGSDFYKGGGLKNFEYVNNIGGGHFYPKPEYHMDFIQFQGSSSDGLIKGNVYLAQSSELAQGIFLDDATYTNIRIEQNIVYSGKNNAIYVSDGSGIEVYNNTLLSTVREGQKGAFIKLPSGSVKENNISTSYEGGFQGSNIIIQHQDPNGTNYYGDLFENALADFGYVTLEDLVPVPGSAADGKGAYDRLMELLGLPSDYMPGSELVMEDPPDDGSGCSDISYTAATPSGANGGGGENSLPDRTTDENTGPDEVACPLIALSGLLDSPLEDLRALVEMYVAYFDRAPDADGLLFWARAFSDGTTFEEMATLFLQQEETQAMYPPDLSDAAFVTEVYGNLLGRVPDGPGFAFWSGLLEAGDVGRDTFILEVLRGVKAPAPSGAASDIVAQKAADLAYLTNKTELGLYYAVFVGRSEPAEAAAVMDLFDGSEESFEAAVDALQGFYVDTLDIDGANSVTPLVGVADDPFAS